VAQNVTAREFLLNPTESIAGCGFCNDSLMGQQISDVGDENLYAVCQHEARGGAVQADCGHLSSRIERLIRLVQSRLAARISGHHPRRQLQDDASVTSSTGSIVPLHVADIDTVDISFDTDDCDMGVAVPDVLIKPVGLYCHVPLKRRHKADTYNVGHQLVNDNHYSTVKADDSFEHLLTETSFTESEVFIIKSGRKVVTDENEVDESKLCDLSRHEVGMDARSRLHNIEGYCRRRPPQSSKLIASPAHLANESRPPEIGSYLAVAPQVSSSDIGLSPIDETAEVMASPALLLITNNSRSTCKHTFSKLSTCNFSSDTLSSGCEGTVLQPSVHMVRNSQMSPSENSAILSFDDISNNISALEEDRMARSDGGFLSRESSINVSTLMPENDALGARMFTEDASHCPVDTHSANDKTAETDKCRVRSAGNSVQVAQALLADYDVFSDKKVTDCVKSKSFGCVTDKCQCQVSESWSSTNSLYPVFLSQDNSFSLLHSSSPSFFVLADAASLSDDKAVCTKANESDQTCFMSHASVPDIAAGIETSPSDLSRTECDTSLPCCDWSTNNNGSGKPVSERVSTGLMVARRQVRYSSDASSPLSPSVTAGEQTAGEQMSVCAGQNLCHAAVSTSQSSLDDKVISPRTVPDHLDFQQQEKFEGWYSDFC